jgi:hypothetical protein
MNSLVGDNPNGQKYAQIGIGGVSIFTGILTTLGNFFRYAQNSESNRVASIAWGKFQRQIAVELALSPMERLDCSDFLNIARAELDRLIEQSPPIPDKIILEFEKEFEAIPALKRPDIAHGVEHTHIFRNTDTRLKQLAVDAVVYMKQKRKIWNESLAPDIDAKVKGEVSKVVPDLMERIKMLEGKLQEKEKEKLPARSPFIMRGRLRMPVSQSRPITPGPPNIILPGTPVQEPIEVLAQPVTEPVAQPVAQPVTEPVAQPVTQPLAQPLAQPLGTTVESTPPLPPLPPSPPVEVAGLLANLPAPNFVQSFDSSEASPDTIDQIVIEVEKKSDDEAAP